MGMSCLDCHDFMDGYNRGKREGVIEELENIKEEAEENSFKKYNINNEFKCFAIELPILNSIINDRIEELKGE